MREGNWRDAIRHDGYLVVRLRVFSVEEGGQNRYVQSGMKATWVGPRDEYLTGLLELPDPAVRSIASGAEGVVHVRPLEPSQWNGVARGAQIGLCKNWPRRLGQGVVLERVGVPTRCVPPEFPLPPHGRPAVAMLRRRPTLGELVRDGMRRFRRG